MLGSSIRIFLLSLGVWGIDTCRDSTHVPAAAKTCTMAEVKNEAAAVTEIPRAHAYAAEEIDESKGIIYVGKGEVSSDDESGKVRPNLKTTQDGRTVLLPQPSDSPLDPLNWTWWKKHTVLLALLPGCFLTDWVITYGTTMVSTSMPTPQTELIIACSSFNKCQTSG